MLCASPRYSPVGSKLSVNPNEFSQPTRYVPPVPPLPLPLLLDEPPPHAGEQQACAERDHGETESEHLLHGQRAYPAPVRSKQPRGFHVSARRLLRRR